MIWHRLVAVLAGLGAATAIPNTHNPASFSSAIKVCFGNRSNLPHHFDVNTIACLSERGIAPGMARTFLKRRKKRQDITEPTDDQGELLVSAPADGDYGASSSGFWGPSGVYLPLASMIFPTTGLASAPVPSVTGLPDASSWGPVTFAGKSPTVEDEQYGQSVQCYKNVPIPYLDTAYINNNRDKLCSGLAEAYAAGFNDDIHSPASAAAQPSASSFGDPNIPMKTEIMKEIDFDGGSLWAYTGIVSSPAKDPKSWLNTLCNSALELLTDKESNANCVGSSSSLPSSAAAQRRQVPQPNTLAKRAIRSRSEDSNAQALPIKGGTVQFLNNGQEANYVALDCTNCVVQIGLQARQAPQLATLTSGLAMPLPTPSGGILVGPEENDEIDLAGSDESSVVLDGGEKILQDQDKEIKTLEDDAEDEDDDSCDASDSKDDDDQDDAPPPARPSAYPDPGQAFEQWIAMGGSV